MDTNRLGDLRELLLCAKLLKNGYEVFRNVSSVGGIDIVAIKDEEIFLIDAKGPKASGSSKRKTSYSLNLKHVCINEKTGDIEVKEAFARNSKDYSIDFDPKIMGWGR